MKKFKISVNDYTGIYKANYKEEALDNYAKEGGYASYDELQEFSEFALGGAEVIIEETTEKTMEEAKEELDNLKNETRYVFTWIGPKGEKEYDVGNSLMNFTTEVRDIFNWMRDVDAVEAKIMFRDGYHREFYFNPYISYVATEKIEEEEA